jgi:aspartyl/glutamyl-tRNA(Asn/Gln) amidotransferase C subunit
MISRQQIIKLGKLAHLRVSDRMAAQLERELKEILRYVERVQKVEVKGVELTETVSEVRERVRPDRVASKGTHAATLRRAFGKRRGDYLLSPPLWE